MGPCAPSNNKGKKGQIKLEAFHPDELEYDNRSQRSKQTTKRTEKDLDDEADQPNRSVHK